MYRVALTLPLIASLGACSLGPSSISSGFAESDYSTSSVRSTPRVESVALGGEPNNTWRTTAKKPNGQQVAKLHDQAPTGSYERAPHGALADRDYSHTALNAELARKLINEYRSEKGLKPLVLNAELTAAAKSHSKDLAKWDRISHYGSDGSNPWDRVKRTGYRARLAAENVGTGQIDFQEVMRGWKASAGHNKNLLLADATHMGIALVQDPKSEFRSFWTLVIGAPM
jgi:uncharacterized protein YkwD